MSFFQQSTGMKLVAHIETSDQIARIHKQAIITVFHRLAWATHTNSGRARRTSLLDPQLVRSPARVAERYSSDSHGRSKNLRHRVWLLAVAKLRPPASPLREVKQARQDRGSCRRNGRGIESSALALTPHVWASDASLADQRDHGQIGTL